MIDEKSQDRKSHQCCAAPDPRKKFDAAPTPTLLCIKPPVSKQAKVDIRVRAIFSPDIS
jgi:hypothetical protein